MLSRAYSSIISVIAAECAILIFVVLIHVIDHGSIQVKIGSVNEPFTKIGDLNTDSSLKNGPFKKLRDLKTDPSQIPETLKRTLYKNQGP